jgi:predicted transcriptional regulator
MQVLLSVKPEYSKKIFSGEKKYEFRKRKPKFMISTVIVYESSPTRSIVGGFSVKRIHSDSPDRIWQKCRESSGIEKSNYLNYCNGAKLIHAIEIDEVFKFKNPIDPSEMIPDFKPPQNFSYLKSSSIFEKLEGSENCVARPRCFYRRARAPIHGTSRMEP